MDKTYTKEDQILATARELFAKYGYKRVSMDEIARDANVVKSTIYQHFKDKDELLEFIINETISEVAKLNPELALQIQKYVKEHSYGLAF